MHTETFDIKKYFPLIEKAIKEYPKYLRQQEELKQKITAHPAAGVLKMPQTQVTKLCNLMLSKKIKFIAIDKIVSGLSDEQYKKHINETNGFIYEEESDSFKIRFFADAGGWTGGVYLIFRIKNNLDFTLEYVGYNTLNIHNQIAVRALINKYITA